MFSKSPCKIKENLKFLYINLCFKFLIVAKSGAENDKNKIFSTLFFMQ